MTPDNHSIDQCLAAGIDPRKLEEHKSDIREGMNWTKDWQEASGDRFRFHITWKAGLRLALNLVKIPDNWIGGLSGNAKLLYERVYLRYIKAEKNEHRKAIVGKLLIAGILIYNYDSAFAEVGNYLLVLFREVFPALYIPPHHCDPDCWAVSGSERSVPGLQIPLKDIVVMDQRVLITSRILPPQHYTFCMGLNPDILENEGHDDHFYAIDTNAPVWLGNGWGYKILRDLGPADALKDTLYGE